MRCRIESILNEKVISPVSGEYFGTGIIGTASGKKYFLKKGGSGRMFRCEANGLKELEKTAVIKTPRVIVAEDDFILTEYISSGSRPKNFFETFGRQFARLHRTKSETFGFYEDNYIGLNPQPNLPTGEETRDWTAFYFNKRLLYQYRLCEKNGYVSVGMRKAFAKLENNISGILQGSEEAPCLLHGDLWSGNFICGENGEAVLIDPAVYYGHREADLAMTKLFGGFTNDFYDAYRKEYPLPDGWQHREGIYRLYHVLNHLNLFGVSYLSETEYILQKYTA